jgi:hypothetical protein
MGEGLSMTRSNDTIEVVLTDEPTRAVLSMALWRAMANPVGGPDDWEDHACGAADLREDDAERATYREWIDQRLAELTATRALIKRVEAAAVGESLEVPVEAAVDGLGYVRDGVEGSSDRFFGAAPEERARIMAMYDAAGALLEQLPTPAEAVA